MCSWEDKGSCMKSQEAMKDIDQLVGETEKAIEDNE